MHRAHGQPFLDFDVRNLQGKLSECPLQAVAQLLLSFTTHQPQVTQLLWGSMRAPQSCGLEAGSHLVIDHRLVHGQHRGTGVLLNQDAGTSEHTRKIVPAPVQNLAQRASRTRWQKISPATCIQGSHMWHCQRAS